MNCSDLKLLRIPGKLKPMLPILPLTKLLCFFNSLYIETKSGEGEVESKSNLNFLFLKYTCF